MNEGKDVCPIHRLIVYLASSLCQGVLGAWGWQYVSVVIYEALGLYWEIMRCM